MDLESVPDHALVDVLSGVAVTPEDLLAVVRRHVLNGVRCQAEIMKSRISARLHRLSDNRGCILLPDQIDWTTRTRRSVMRTMGSTRHTWRTVSCWLAVTAGAWMLSVTAVVAQEAVLEFPIRPFNVDVMLRQQTFAR